MRRTVNGKRNRMLNNIVNIDNNSFNTTLEAKFLFITIKSNIINELSDDFFFFSKYINNFQKNLQQ